jgi:hypothetical protein
MQKHSDTGNRQQQEKTRSGALGDCGSTVILTTDSNKRRLDLGSWEIVKALILGTDSNKRRLLLGCWEIVEAQ